MVVGTTTKTTRPSRQPSTTVISNTMLSVARLRWNKSSSDFSVAVLP